MSHLWDLSSDVRTDGLTVFLYPPSGSASPWGIKIQILVIQSHVHVGEDVCFHIKSSYGWSNIQLPSYEPKYVKIWDFKKNFSRKSPIFSLKIKILKIRKHRRLAEDVCSRMKPSHDNSHTHPKRSIVAVWWDFSFSATQNGHQLSILDLFTW